MNMASSGKAGSIHAVYLKRDGISGDRNMNTTKSPAW
jgi:hypothetical protein